MMKIKSMICKSKAISMKVEFDLICSKVSSFRAARTPGNIKEYQIPGAMYVKRIIIHDDAFRIAEGGMDISNGTMFINNRVLNACSDVLTFIIAHELGHMLLDIHGIDQSGEPVVVEAMADSIAILLTGVSPGLYSDIVYQYRKGDKTKISKLIENTLYAIGK